MSEVNLFTAEVQKDADDPDGYHNSYARVGPQVGAEQLGLSVYELPPGQSICPYHYENAEEEWLIVLTGRPTLRTPDGERQLRPGDTVCFPAGAAGAHAVRGPGRILMLGARRVPSVVVYPDSDKVGTRPADPSDRLNFPRSAAVGYWDGEA